MVQKAKEKAALPQDLILKALVCIFFSLLMVTTFKKKIEYVA